MSRRIFVLMICVCGVSGELQKKWRNCKQLPEPVLSEILGPAFNSRYMSVEKPKNESSNAESQGPKRAPANALSFYVDEDYSRELGDVPAWLAKHKTSPEESTRRKRAIKAFRQWECESKVRWMDLGPDYFPRYLRTIECISTSCWYGMLKCKPRSFTVKILKRRRDRCVGDDTKKTGSAGLPAELRELWVWEEHALNFCCDCAT